MQTYSEPNDRPAHRSSNDVTYGSNRRSPLAAAQLPTIRHRRHFLWPLLGWSLALAYIYIFQIDYRLAHGFYTLEVGKWGLRHAWLTSTVLHEYGQQFSFLWGVALLLITAFSYVRQPLKPYRRGLITTDIAVIASLLLVSLSKHLLALPCPYDLAQYGGDLAGTAAYTLYPGEVGGCFPAGHAAGGYCLFALYFLARIYRVPGYRYMWLPGLLVGLLYGIDQQLRGAHFLSHDLVSAGICWFVSLLCFRIAFGGQSANQNQNQSDPQHPNLMTRADAKSR